MYRTTEPKIDNVQEIESELPMLQEFTTNTLVEKGHTSLCLPMDQQPCLLLAQNEECACVFDEYQEKVNFIFLKILLLIFYS